MRIAVCAIVMAVGLFPGEGRTEAAFGPAVKLGADQRKAVEAGVKKRLLQPEKATISGLSAQIAKNGIVVCGRLDAPEYHPDVRRRVFIGSLDGSGANATFQVWGPVEPDMSAYVESMCRSHGLF